MQANNDVILQENKLLKKENLSLMNQLSTFEKKSFLQQEKNREQVEEMRLAIKKLTTRNKHIDKLIAEREQLRLQHQTDEKRINEFISINKKLTLENEKKEIHTNKLRVTNYSRSLIEASRDPLFTINTNGKITDMNNASINVIGLSRKKLIGTDFSTYFTEPEKAKKGFLEIFEKGFITDFPLTITDHKLTDVLFNGSIYKDEHGVVLGIVVVARDITDLKRTEKELTESKIFTELALEITEEAKSKAESAQTVAENALKAKQQFLSNMSHEIRTPMNAIIGFTKVLLKTKLSDKQTEYLDAIKLSGDALIVLINDILDLAKVDAGKMTFERIPFKMRLSLAAMLHLFHTKILEKNISLKKTYDTTIPETLLGDPVRLHQIILNLVSNAVKFTDSGSIHIDIKLIEESDTQVLIQFSVIDTGIGIPLEKIDHIFENFQQATSETSRLYGGTGLGLAIVKQLIEQQQGTIEVKSVLGKGTCFLFTLPFKKTSNLPEIENIPLNEVVETMKNIRVLEVEDIPLNQLLMRTLLDEFGFEKDIASNGKIALDFLAKSSYDIILMDLQMPEMNGFETTDYIRNVLKSNIPIIALTADVTTVDLDKCKEVGMNDYIAKPVDEEVLLTKISHLVKNKSIEDASTLHVPMLENYKFINLEYLNTRTKSNPQLMLEMISLYLNQTPGLILEMKQSLFMEDWSTLQATAHKIMPSFSIMGMSNDFEIMAKKVQEYANSQKQTEGISELVHELEQVCVEACKELEIEVLKIKKNNFNYESKS
jgi:PAS domain S-box-containing protein